jgi:hypothetical protein
MSGELRKPIGNFVLAAAGEELDLDAAILTMGPVMTGTNEGFEKTIRAQAAEKAAKHGIEQSRLLAHYGARLKFMFAAKVAKPRVQSEPADMGGEHNCENARNNPEIGCDNGESHNLFRFTISDHLKTD